MRVISQTSEFRKHPGPIVLAVGFFDGVHKGHQAVIASTIERAREMAGQAWVLTFNRHPLSLLAPSKAPPLLTTLEERLELLACTGLDGALVLKFTRQLANVEPELFVQWLCDVQRKPKVHDDGAVTRRSGLCEVRCGHNWRFGRRAAGSPELLAQLGKIYGFRVVVMPFARYQGKEISSTRIRCAIQEGRLESASAMLGRPHAVRGTVVRGRGVGHSLNVATANLQPYAAVLPPNGVYAVRVKVGEAWYNGVSNLGYRPTFADAMPERAELETHLLDFSGDLYGATIEVSFLAHLRDELVFATVDDLLQRIAQDIIDARQFF